jgi:hypothetical protein
MGLSVSAFTVAWVKPNVERLKLADDIVAAGFKKTMQRQAKNDKATIEQMATEMANGTFDWSRSGRKSGVDPNGAVLDGNHRVIVAALSGKPIPPGQIVRLKKPTLLDVYDWVDTLPPPAPKNTTAAYC